ncbi:MAG TPA: TCR/Tet family MFS transporter [Candidatus Saccharimonadia bacterium]|nr:TCR/Tet family MFS transporter [Candidatus Saccharimonadia bacterium]
MTPAAAPRRAALAFIFVTVVLDVLALGIVIPVLPTLILSFLDEDVVRTAEIVGVFGTVWAAMQFVFSPLLGALSDRFGRRPIILVSNFGLAFDYVLMALAPTLGWLFVGRVISGITAASITTAGAYIADVTPPDKRAAGFGMLGAAFGLGFILGPALGGVLGDVDPRLPFWIAGALSFANALYGVFVLPESLPPEKRAAFSWRRANPVGSLRLLRRHPELSGLALLAFVQQLAHYVYPSVFVLYAFHRYGWTAKTVGLTLAGVGVLSAIVQGGLAGRIVAKLRERRTLLLGLSFGIVGFTLYGWAPTGLAFWLAMPLMALWGLASPASQSLMTQRLEAHEQGQLQGALTSLMALAGLFGPGLFTQIFAKAIEPTLGLDMPGAPFFVSAALLVIGLVIAERATRGRSSRARAARPGA